MHQWTISGFYCIRNPVRKNLGHMPLDCWHQFYVNVVLWPPIYLLLIFSFLCTRNPKTLFCPGGPMVDSQRKAKILSTVFITGKCNNPIRFIWCLSIKLKINGWILYFYNMYHLQNYFIICNNTFLFWGWMPYKLLILLLYFRKCNAIL